MMKKIKIPALYKKYHIDRDYGLESLFEELTQKFDIKSVLYPGSYVHITPSFYIPRAVYVDMQLPAKKFFDNPNVLEYIESKKTYKEKPNVTFYHQLYEDIIAEPEESFDLLVSQYAGFISERTKRYLKNGGLLLVNDSHGDAGLAAIDKDYKLIAVVDESGFLDKNLDQYFKPKKEIEISVESLKKLGKGIKYTKNAQNYIFKKKCSSTTDSRHR